MAETAVAELLSYYYSKDHPCMRPFFWKDGYIRNTNIHVERGDSANPSVSSDVYAST